MATFAELKDLMLHAAKRTAPANYSVESVDKAFVEALNEKAGSINQFMKNRYDLYQIMIETIDEVVPNRTIEALAPIAEIRQVPQGQKTIFKQRVGRQRAKKFLTQVGLSGVYETFRLDEKEFEVKVHARGGATTLDFERMLDGAEVLAEYMDVLMEGLADSVWAEVQQALRAAINTMGVSTTNMYSDSSFVADHMVKLCNVVKAYGGGAVIFAPPEFVAAMGPDVIVPITAASNTALSIMPVRDDVESIHRTGYINLFRGVPIVQIPQSYVDEKNQETLIDPQLAYILPTGGEKVVKVVFEGDTQIYDWVNKDNSLEINVYKKMGVAILAYNNWGIYRNTGVTQTFVG